MNMKRKALSILAVLALCLTMLPMAAFAAPISWPAEGESVIVDGKEYTYLGDVTKTGLEVGEWEVNEYGPAGIAKAGDGYVSYTVEDGIAYITVNNATIRAEGEDTNGIQVSDYDVSIHGVGTNVIEAADAAIDVTGCLTMTGEFERIAGLNTGIRCLQVWGDDLEGNTVKYGGDAMINANVGEIVGTENVGIDVQCSLILNGDLGDVSGGIGIYVGSGLTSDSVQEGALIINGSIDSVVGFVDTAIHGRGDVVIGEDAEIGQIVGDTIGISVDCIADEEGAPVDDSSLTIAGTVGPIIASQIQEDAEWPRFGLLVLGGDVVIGEGATVESIYGDDYGAWVEGGKVIVKGTVTNGITGGGQDIYEVEWPSFWAHAEVMDAILFDLVPADLQCKYTQAATRAEYCALATCLYEAVTGGPIELTDEDVLPFTDVTEDDNIAKMYKVGVVNGVGENRFAPNNQLTREQAATMLSRLAEALGQPLPAAQPAFADNDKIFAYAYAAVGQVQAAGIMEGKENNLFDPKGSYTREQSILTMDRLFNMVFWDNAEE